MPESTLLRILLDRIRAGDQQAAADLVRRYEPALRRTVRARLRDRQLRRLVDSTDICQSVLLGFFERLKLGEYTIDEPDQLLKLLTVMARNRLINQALHQQAARRDRRRLAPGPVEKWQVSARGSSPSQHVETQELVQKAHELLTTQEQHVLELRKEGQEWTAIASQVGKTPEALRKHLGRTLARVAQLLGLEGGTA
jgi:RNA polymerase sigma-70 factor (ECF subfamily)